ncbi:chloride channel protein [Muricoccus pecuniae]|uniref:CIC family chloride channel protein n=1 Tax=Muricoccus pecuniae TaxID=693023 RepID=A0A840Y5U0_9PROT|nr:chloride channel protein [Roseomonas pecuniae]MBB5696105.1 CIC family chloride channel protein [Roseomonas pecuniae]
MSDDTLPQPVPTIPAAPLQGAPPLPARAARSAASEALAPLRAWIRGTEPGLVALATLIGVASGLLASAMGELAHGMQAVLFGTGDGHGLSAFRVEDPLRLLLLPALGGLLLGLLNLALNRWHRRNPVDPIEANALHGGRMALQDGAVVAGQNLISNGFGASVGLEAAYTQVAGGVASRLGILCGLRRGDLRVLVGCGAAGAIAAAFDAPLTGAFYAFELVIGTYAIASLAPVVASAVAATLVVRGLHGQTYLVEPGGVASPGWEGYPAALALGILCALAAIGLMRGVGIMEGLVRRAVPWACLRPAFGGLVVGVLALLSPGVLSAGHGALHIAFNTEGPARAALLLLLLKALASAISIGAGFRGGLFFASLLLGALLGKVLASSLVVLGLPLMDALFLAVVGMSAFGTAVIGAPLAMTFLALETTGSFPVAGAVLTAVAVSGIAVRRLFGYSFATWRFHLRGEAIRSAHDVGWLRELTVGRMMRRDVRTVRADTRLTAFRRDFPLGSTERVIVLDEAGLYAGMVLVADAHAAELEAETVAALLRQRDRALLPAMNAREAMAVFDAAEAEALPVIDSLEGRRVLGMLTAGHVLRRYGEELDKRRQEEVGVS